MHRPAPVPRFSDRSARRYRSSRARAYTLYSSCFLPSRLHRSGEMLVIQCVVGEGKGEVCLHRKEIGPRLGGKKHCFVVP